MLTLPNNQRITVLHIEPTDACNAACPQCGRELGINFDKSDPANHLTVDQIKALLDEEFIKNLDKMFVCGNYGDPAAGKHTLDILRYFRSINPNIVLGMNTNGSLRSTQWWRELASILSQPRDYVVWSIDGLSDTNHIYRVNTTWSKIMDNASAFIQAGGSAHWDMLIFEHNEHQVKSAEQVARAHGFKWFRAKVSKRFDFAPIDFLKPPASFKPPQPPEGAIQCYALRESSIYISAKAETYPCCWLGFYPESKLQNFDSIQQSWSTGTPHHICQRTCGQSISGTGFSDQWRCEVQLC